jgi:sigma-B regulation protein RsbU (phosphoserine phosphatase)
MKEGAGEHRFSTFRTKLLILVTAILVTSACAVIVLTSMEVKKSMHEKGGEEARTALSLVRVGIENQYQSILYHREYALERYKEQLKNLVSILEGHIDQFYDLYEKGILTEQQAKDMVGESVRRLKYGDNDYFFIYDLKGFVISHPKDDIWRKNRIHFQDVKGNYVVKSFIDIAKNKGEGFYSYWFERLGEKQSVEKLCYVTLYKKWNWAIGTGVYIGDIERDAQKRLEEVLTELRDSFAKMTIAKTGYFFLFNDQKQMLVHPTLAGKSFADFGLAGQEATYFEGLVNASRNPALPLVYRWDKPQYPQQLRFWKESYVTRFTPLGWYIASSIYKDELEEPANRIIRGQVVVSGLILVLSILAAVLMVRKMTNDLKRLTAHAQQLSSSEFALLDQVALGIMEIALKSRDEIGRLARAFAYMIQSLISHIKTLKETTAIKEKMESELRIAHDIQMSMVPHPPELQGKRFEVFAALEPARQVGGDFYDFFLLDDRYLCLIIGDVSDKGVPAALFMSKSKTVLRLFSTTMKESAGPAEVLRRANAELCEENDLCMFVTLFYSVMDLETGRFNYGSAGHNPPCLITRDGKARFLEASPGTPLGAMEGVSFAEQGIIIEPGDSIVLYTDGVTEATNGGGAFFSDERLLRTLSGNDHLSARDLTSSLLKAVKDHVAGAPQSDDITILCFEYKADEQSPTE